MKKISIMILVLVAAFVSCKKTPEVNLKYVDIERDLVTVGTTTANIQCDYEYIATLKKAFLYYGEGEDETDMTSKEMRVVQKTLYVELTGLKENTTYSYYYEFVNGFNSMRSSLKTFKTESGSGGGDEPPTPVITLPTVITASVTGITTNSAQCGGEVTNDGGAEVTERGICWSTSANPSLSDNHVAVGTGIGAFNATVSGLNESTTYHVRAYAINEKGAAYGLDVEFKTLSSGGSAQLPVVVTNEVTGITAHSASCGGEVTSDGGATVTERGICWSTNANPTITNSHVSAGAGTGTFSAMMSGLSASTTYHVRAYATNEAGTAYGTDKEFTTLEGGAGGDVPEGAINGLFAINDNGDKVYFSQGNLQFQASTNTWRFAENQWNYVGGYDGEVYHGNVIGSDNGYASSTYSGWIDLFGWGTSGWNNGNVYYQPYDRAYLADWNAADFGYGYGPTDGANYNFNLTGDYSNADWGVYNPIINGGNQSGQWRTLTQPEWYFLLNSRITSSGIRFARAIVNNVCGLVLLPDDWNDSVYTFNYPNRTDAPYSTNEITTGTWSILENHGSVFLPAAGQYNSASSGYFNFEEGGFGGYWSATASATYFDYNTGEACLLTLVASWGTYAYIDMSSVRYHGWSVRLVQDFN